MKRKVTKIKLPRSLQNKIADLLDKEKLTGANLDEIRIRMRYGEEGEIKLYFITELEDKDLEIETPDYRSRRDWLPGCEEIDQERKDTNEKA